MSFVLVAYLIVLAVIAIRSVSSVKNVADFFVARKSASTVDVAGSLLATLLGGSAVIGSIDNGVTQGAASAWLLLSGAIGLFALVPFAERAYNLGKFSLPDLVENIFGKGPRRVASVVIPLAWTGIVAAQIIAAAKLLPSFVPLPYKTSVFICSAVFILYTMAGGQISILRTDIFQAILIILGLATMGICAVETLWNNSTIAANVLASHQQHGFPFNENFTPLALFVLILTYGTTYTAGPDMYSRIFCAKDAKAARKAVLAAAIILVPIALLIGFLGLYGSTLAGEVQQARITAIAMNVMPPWLYPLFAIFLLSVVLSSADTTLLSSSIIATQALFKKDINSIDNHDNKESKNLRTARIVILVNGLLALLIALKFNDIIATLLLALAVYAGAFTIPVLWGIAGLKARPKFVSAAIIAGGTLSLIGKLYPGSPIQITGQFSMAFGDMLLLAAFAVNAAILAIGRR
ncbi:MAG: sodium:solute symporter family protein [Fibrobacter sp.]|nr:sodium:solute symporter family protein [Fibrobacter sp.]